MWIGGIILCTIPGLPTGTTTQGLFVQLEFSRFGTGAILRPCPRFGVQTRPGRDPTTGTIESSLAGTTESFISFTRLPGPDTEYMYIEPSVLQ